jgi:hypothetical protein
MKLNFFPFSIFHRRRFNPHHLETQMANIADNVLALQAQVAALQAKVDSLSVPAPAAVDLTPVLTAIAEVKADLTPSS